jgi:sec-independent protein translocase protein TatC
LIQNDARMTFTQHLGELRTRLIRSCVAILAGFILCYILREQIFQFVAYPLRPLAKQGLIVNDTLASPAGQPDAAVPAAGQPEAKPDSPDQTQNAPPKSLWTTFNPMEGFLVQLKLALYAGIVLALPIVVYQLCAFIFPGLTPSERKVVRFLLIGSTVFVIFGVATAYFAVFPMVMPYLSTFVPAGVEVQFRMSETVSLILKGMLGFAIAFQFPMVVMILVYLGLLSPSTLRKYRRHAIVAMAIGSAAFTPPDPFSMIAMLVPLVFMYEISIWASVIILRKRSQAEAAADAP